MYFAASVARDLFEAGLNEAASCVSELWAPDLRVGNGRTYDARRANTENRTLSPTAVINDATVSDEHGLVKRRQASADDLSIPVSAVKRSDRERRHGNASNGAEKIGVVHHDVSQRGAARRSVGGRNASPISIIRPPQMGHKSIR